MTDPCSHTCGSDAVLPPLQDPSKHIRLLQVEPAGFDDAIYCTIAVHSIDDAPKYNVISYTWGSETPQNEIFVGGSRYAVRENCHYALQQARNFQAPSRIWVDSVCIDQNNLHEKSAQVGIMGDIYAQAATVLVCIGESDEHSDVIQAFLERYHELDPDKRGYLTKHINPDLEDHVRQSNRLVTAYWGIFCQRPYFQRLWVAQEIFESRWKAMVQCGTRSYPCLWLQDSLMLNTLYTRDPFVLKMKSLRPNYDAPATLGKLLEESCRLLCGDPKDRIYGTLRLFDWESSGHARPVPDYAKSPVQLALDLLHDGHFTEIPEVAYLVSAMEITFEDLADSSKSLSTSRARTLQWTDRPRRIAIIRSSGDGQLCAGPWKIPASGDTSYISITDMADPSAEGSRLNVSGSATQSAVVCEETMPGDLLVQTNWFSTILRPSGSSFTVVGKAFDLQPGTGYSTFQESAADCFCLPRDPLTQQPRSNIPETTERRWLIPHLQFAVSAEALLASALELHVGRCRDRTISPSDRAYLDTLEFPKVGTEAHDVSLMKKNLGDWRELVTPPVGWKLEGPVTGCPTHVKDASVYVEAARRGAFWLYAEMMSLRISIGPAVSDL